MSKNMNTKHTIKFAVLTALTVTTALLSCVMDTKESMAWGKYHRAKDSLDAGNPYAAQEILGYAGKGGDSSVLGRKIDSLRLVIEKAIEEDKKTGKDSLIIK